MIQHRIFLQEQEYWYIATIGKAHGVKGLAILQYHGEEPNIEHYNPYLDALGKHYILHHKGQKKNGLLIAIDGYNDKDAIMALQGKELFIAKNTLPELNADTIYIQQMIEYQVITNTNPKPIGQINAWHDYGAGLILSCLYHEQQKDNILLIPMNGWAIIAINHEAKTITIDANLLT